MRGHLGAAHHRCRELCQGSPRLKLAGARAHRRRGATADVVGGGGGEVIGPHRDRRRGETTSPLTRRGTALASESRGGRWEVEDLKVNLTRGSHTQVGWDSSTWFRQGHFSLFMWSIHTGKCHVSKSGKFVTSNSKRWQECKSHSKVSILRSDFFYSGK
jgi:hypothetical protein